MVTQDIGVGVNILNVDRLVGKLKVVYDLGYKEFI